MRIPPPVLVFLCQTLKEEWKDNFELKKDEKNEFQLVQMELQLLKAFLKDSSRKSDKSELFKEKERQIRELTYEVEDTIAICLTNKASTRTKNPLHRFIRRLGSRMAKDVRSLREKKIQRALDFIEKEKDSIHNDLAGATIPVPVPDNNFMGHDRLDDVSYDSLSHDSKSCFLYTGMFPEDHEIRASTLMELWIAEGFIRPNEGSGRFEEAAEEILGQLVDKSLLVVTKRSLGRVRACKIQPRLRQFCRNKASDGNFYKVVTELTEYVFDQLGSNQYRRICFQSDQYLMSLSPKLKGRSIRSFMCFLKEPFQLDPLQAAAVCDGFRVVRIFSCRSITFTKFPDFSRLKLLKHINISVDKSVEAVPKAIAHLLNLRTLAVYMESKHLPHSIALQSNIWEMVNLRRVKTNATFVLDEELSTRRGGSNLEIVGKLSPDSCTERLCTLAPNLKTLGIGGAVENILETSSLERFLHLEELKLINASRLSRPLILVQHNTFPPNLKILTLSKTSLDWEMHMRILTRIKSLEVLKLKEFAFSGTVWEDMGDEGFDKLQLLLIETSNLTRWKASAKNFPCLRSLVLRSCKCLVGIPDDLVKKIENLELKKVSTRLVDFGKQVEQMRKEEEVQQYISVVPFKLTIIE